MNKSTEVTKRADTSLTRDWIDFARYQLGPYLGGRRGLLIMAVAVLVIGGALNWSWLVAVGLAPLLIAIAPCAVMCALGLCMNKMGGQSCSDQSSMTEKRTDAHSSASDLEVRGPSDPVVSLSDRRAELADDLFEQGDEQATARRHGEAGSEKG